MELMMIVMTMRMVRIATRFFIILDLWAKLLETDGVRERLAAGLEGEEGVHITWLRLKLMSKCFLFTDMKV